MSIRCPHCDTPASKRSSRRVSNLTRETYYQCRNIECGATFKSIEEVVKEFSPSGVPRPGLQLQKA